MPKRRNSSLTYVDSNVEINCVGEMSIPTKLILSSIHFGSSTRTKSKRMQFNLTTKKAQTLALLDILCIIAITTNLRRFFLSLVLLNKTDNTLAMVWAVESVTLSSWRTNNSFGTKFSFCISSALVTDSLNMQNHTWNQQWKVIFYNN